MTAGTRDATVAAACQGLQQAFDSRAHWLAVAPGRVNLMGEHTDYNAGLALPFALAHSVVAAGAPSSAGLLRVRSAAEAEPVQLELTAAPLPCVGGWGAYVAGAAQALRAAGHPLQPCDVYCASDLPAGAGLSSSAALSLALLQVLAAAAQVELAPAELVALAQAVERDYAGVPCGILDPYAIVHGRADTLLLLDCATATASSVAWPAEAVELLVIDTGVKHSNASGGYAARRAECEAAAAVLGEPLGGMSVADLPGAARTLSATAARRVHHVVSECARVRAVGAGIEAGDWPAVGAAFYASHASLRDDYAVSCAESDALVDAARQLGSSAGIWGARMTGGGFGGAVVVLAAAGAGAAAAEQLCSRYRGQCGREARSWLVRPAAGARRLPPPAQ